MSVDPLVVASVQEQQQESGKSIPQFQPNQGEPAVGNDSPDPLESAQPLSIQQDSTQQDPAPQETAEQQTTESVVQVPPARPAADAGSIDPLYYLLLLPILVPLLILVVWLFRKRRQPWNEKQYRPRFDGHADRNEFREKVTPEYLRDQQTATDQSALVPEDPPGEMPAESDEPEPAPSVIQLGHMTDEDAMEPFESVDQSEPFESESLDESESFDDSGFFAELDLEEDETAAVHTTEEFADEPPASSESDDLPIDVLAFDEDVEEVPLMQHDPSPGHSAPAPRHVSNATDAVLTSAVPLVTQSANVSQADEAPDAGPQIRALESELIALRESREQLQREAAELRTQLVSSEKQIAKLTSNDKLPELEKELESLTAELDEAHAAVPAETRNELAELLEQLQIAEEAREQATIALTNAQSEQTSTRQRVDELIGEKSTLATQIEELQQQVADASRGEQDREDLQEQLTGLSAEMTELRDQLQVAKEARDLSATALADAKSEQEIARGHIEELNAEKSGLAGHVKQLQQQIDQASAARDEHDREDLQQQLAALDRELAAARSDKDQLQSRLESMESEQTHMQSRLSEADGELQRLRDELLVTNQGPSAEELTSLNSRIEQLESELAAAADRPTADELDVLNSCVQQLEQELDNTQKQHAVTRDELEDARDQLAQRTSPSALTASDTEQQLHEKKIKLAKVKQKLREKLDIITELHKRLRAAKKESVNLNIRVTELENMVESQREELARQTVLLERNQLDFDE